MALCLYHPEFGYYMRGFERTGIRGDYFTSADLHPIFARLVARQAAEMWRVLGRPSVFTWVEMGAGLSPNFRQTYSSIAGSTLAKVPTAPEILPMETSRAEACNLA